MQWTNWPAPLLFGVALIATSGFAHRPRAFQASITLFATGCLAGLAIESQTTMIPAHYHGTIGAFTLVLIAAAIARISPTHEAPMHDRPSHLPLALYSIGIFMLIAGLAWSGTMGAPRKTPFSGEGADVASMLAAGLTGLGGAVTIAGVTFFAVIAAPRIYRLCNPRPPQHSAQKSHGSGAPTFASAQ
jgi:heme/copper-type cytochrome/quinol oxidase subunit 1